MANATVSTATRVRWRFFSNRIHSAVVADRILCEGKRPRSITISNWSRKKTISHMIPGKVLQEEYQFMKFISDVTISSRDSSPFSSCIFLTCFFSFFYLLRMSTLQRQGIAGNVLQQRFCSSRLHFVCLQ